MDRVFVTIDSVEREIFPNGYRDAKFVWEKEEGWIFYRLKFSGTLTLTGDDFNDFMAVADDCDKELIRIERVGKSDWNGYFSIIDGEINLDDCTFTFAPRADDPYEAFFDEGNEPYNIIENTAITVSLGATNYTNCRDLKQVIQSMIDIIDPALTLDSDFLDLATNPITEYENRYRYLAIAQNSDIKVPDASEPVRFAYISFLEMMTWLRDAFQLYWSIDGTDLVLEHISHYYSANEIDLTDDIGDARARRYNFSKERMFKFERFEMRNGDKTELNRDFIQHTISYDGKCVMEKDNEINRSTPFVTDIASLQVTPAIFPDDGFFLFACDSGGASRDIYINIGFTSGMSRVNADLSIANLINNFWRWDRILPTGRISTPIAENFWTTQPNKIQELTITNCDDLDVYANFITALGNTLNVDGRLIRAEEGTMGGTTRLTLGYSYEPRYVVPPDPPIKSITVLHSNSEIGTLRATFSELTAGDLVLGVVWVVTNKDTSAIVDSGGQSWNVPNGVLTDDEIITDLPAHQSNYCYGWTINPGDGSWTVYVNQSPELICP